MSKISKELQELNKIIDDELKLEEENIENMEINKNLLLSLQENASYITDNRLSEYAYHSIESILLVVIFGIMARYNKFTYL